MTDFLFRAAEELSLGSVTAPPQQLSGGYLHRMYSLFTDRGRYAAKLLNSHIMARASAMENFHRAEQLERRLEEAGIPILPALSFSGHKMQQLDGRYFYLFDWFDGRSLPSGEITEDHCRIIGAQLAKIHRIDLRCVPAESQPLSIRWDDLIHKLRDRNPDLHRLLLQHRDLLYECQSLANAAIGRLAPLSAICHNDMDSKNVLWRNGQCRIIDLECLDWSHPHLEVYETALCWSGIEQCSVDPHRFESFLSAYSGAGGSLPANLTDVHDANTGRLAWLEYNLERALGVGCSAEEVSTGVSESFRTIAQLAHCREIRNLLCS